MFNNELNGNGMTGNVEKVDIISRSYYLNNAEKNGVEIPKESLLNFRNESTIFPSRILWNRVKGVTNFWKNEEYSDVSDCIISILSSMAREWSIFSYCIIGNKNNIEFYIGTIDNHDSYGNPSDILTNSLAAYMPGIDLEKIQTGDFMEKIQDIKVGGLITGYPSRLPEKETSQPKIRSLSEIDNICRGMLGNRFILMFTATREKNDKVIMSRKTNERVMTEVSRHVEEEGVAVGAAI